jgi:hypothetical protein
VTGALLVFTAFDERQNVVVNDLRGDVEVLKSQAENWSESNIAPSSRITVMEQTIDRAAESINQLREHLRERLAKEPQQAEHIAALLERTDALGARLASLREQRTSLVNTPARLLKSQTPHTLFRLRFVEIGLPLALSCVSILLTLRYPLTEARWREIKETLDKRHASEAV